MNADFEVELAASNFGVYRRTLAFEQLNRRLAPHLLWLARPGDALLLAEPWSASLREEARRRQVELVSPTDRCAQADKVFTPWGWTASALALARQMNALTPQAISLATVKRVNSKLFSHALECEWGVALPGATTARSLDELQAAIERACPRADDKWVVKSPFGFAARDRVLGRGPRLERPAAVWATRRFTHGETLIFQPWLQVIREYGVVMSVASNGETSMHGVSDLQTNGAGTGTGYLLGRRIHPQRLAELERIGAMVGARLFSEGYAGPFGVDALEHAGGLHPLLEINARYTMGFVALAVERALKPNAPVFWSTRQPETFPPQAFGEA